MQKAVSTSVLLFLLMLTSCASLHRGIPRGQRHARTAEYTSNTAEQTIVQRSPDGSDEVPLKEKSSTGVLVSETTDRTDGKEKPLHSTVGSVPAENDDTITEVLADDEAMVEEALDSERVAKNALNFAYLPIGSIILFPLLFVGIIGTLVCLRRFKSYEYVTEEGLRLKRQAIRTLIAACVVPFVLLLFLLFILLLL